MTRVTTCLAITLGAVMAWCPSPAVAQRAQPGDTEVLLINYHAQAKDHAAATLLSVFPGFGAGQFYSGYPGRGFVVGAGQAVGLGLALTGAAVGDRGQTAHDVLQVIGVILFAAFKLADVGLAPVSAADHNRDLAMRLRIPLIGSTRRELPLDEPPGTTVKKKAEPAKPLPEPQGFQY